MAMTPATMPISSGPPKFLRKLAVDVLRQASNGPTPVRKSKNRAMGRLIVLKNGTPTLIFVPRTHSESTGNKVPEITAMQATSRIRLLNRKLDSRETSDSSVLSLRRESRVRPDAD